jgi:hypothetical protein
MRVCTPARECRRERTDVSTHIIDSRVSNVLSALAVELHATRFTTANGTAMASAFLGHVVRSTLMQCSVTDG